MRHPPSLSSLRLFLQVAYNRSFSEASRISNVSQPALSRTIRLLEEQLDTRLFDRNSRNVALTSAGEALLPIVERLTADFDHAFSELAHSFAGERGRVVVGALPSVAAGALPSAISSFRTRYPQVEVILHDHLSGNLYQQMLERQIDLAITTPPETEGFEFEKLMDDPLVLVCPIGSDLDEPGPAQWSVFSEHPFIAMAPRSSVRELTDAAFNIAGLSVRGLYDCTQLATVGALIHAGLGITALPLSTLGMLHSDRIATRELEQPSIIRRIGIATLSGRTLPPAADAFRRHFLQKFRTDRQSGNAGNQSILRNDR
ncbi:LysR family transcriptional regulator [Novosphingobium kaempferiae]|uniref:LysR family transcriptional regulator n=1 Tax=Novosphingobium kaempferiae TaxID=2896849 RepID=UPI001E646FA5|nr:LysR family transcriptional regulator [Novosphingobium kaempferiae]